MLFRLYYLHLKWFSECNLIYCDSCLIYCDSYLIYCYSRNLLFCNSCPCVYALAGEIKLMYYCYVLNALKKNRNLLSQNGCYAKKPPARIVNFASNERWFNYYSAAKFQKNILQGYSTTAQHWLWLSITPEMLSKVIDSTVEIKRRFLLKQ